MCKVNLNDILEAIELASDDGSYFLNVKTGDVVYIDNETMGIADGVSDEEIDEYEDWEQDLIREYIDIEMNYENYLTLPSQYEINEYDIMVEFCSTLSGEKRDILLSSLNGRGAFRRFQDTAYNLGVRNNWFKFRENSFKQLAIEWCKDNYIEWKDDSNA